MEYGLSLGSNKDDRLKNLTDAVNKIGQIDKVTILDRSPTYETQPVNVPLEYADQEFLNTVVIIETLMSPNDLLDALQKIEISMGRPSGHGKNTPRTIDIDIVYAGNMVVKTTDLSIPHPYWKQRRFVVEPLSTLRPHLVLPETEKPIKDILNSLPENPKVTLYQQ